MHLIVSASASHQAAHATAPGFAVNWNCRQQLDIVHADVDSDSELEHDISRDADEDSFIPLGVEARAPSPPNNEAVKAQSRAFWLLSQRTYTRHRLEQKLLSYKKFPDDAVAWAMQRVEVSWLLTSVLKRTPALRAAAMLRFWLQWP